MPDDQLRRAAGVDQDRLRIARLPIRRQRAPELLAGPLVERDHLGVGLAPDETDESVAVDQRRPGDPPRRNGRIEILDVVPLPDDAAVGDVEHEEVAHRPEDVHPVAIERRRGARTDRVGQL